MSLDRQYMPNELVEALQALVSLELAVGELYKACSVRWPDDVRFWLEVARKEMDHAHAIERMLALIAFNPGNFAPLKAIRVNAVDTIISGIESRTEQVRSDQLSKNNALHIALDLETSVMENKFYEMVQTTDPAFLKICSEIMAQTRDHKSHFENRIAELKT